MVKAKRIWRESQHPRDAKGRFSRRGGAAWIKRAATELTSAADAGSTRSASGRPQISRSAKAGVVLQAHADGGRPSAVRVPKAVKTPGPTVNVARFMAPDGPRQAHTALPAPRKRLPRPAPGVAALRAQRAEEQAPQMAAMVAARTAPESAPVPGAADYASMRQHTLVSLARQAGVPHRNRSRTEIANDLAKRDAEVAAKRKAKLNPSGVGASVDTPRDSRNDGGMTSTTPEASQAATPNTDHLKRPKARKGDLVVVEETTADYSASSGGRTERTEVRVGVVTSTDRNGIVTGWSLNADGSYPRKVDHRQKTFKLEAERVDVAAAIAAAQANPWPHDTSKTGKPFSSVEEARAVVRPHVGDQTEKLKAARAAAPKGRDPMKLKVGDVVTFPAFRQGDPPVTAEVIDAPFGKGDQRNMRVRVKMRVLDGPNAGKEGYHEFKPSERPKVSGSTRGERAMAGLVQQISDTLDEIEAERAPAPRTPTTNRKQIPRDTKERALQNDRDGMRGVYRRHANVTRAEFDAMPEAERNRILSELRMVRDSGEEQRYYTRSKGIGSPPGHGMRRADHVQAAEEKVRELLKPAPVRVDNSISGRAARMRAGDVRAMDGATIAELNEAAREAGLSGGNTGWPRTKLTDYIRNQIQAGPDRMRAGRNGDLADALRGASPGQVLAVLDALESDGMGQTTVAKLKAAAKALGIKVTGSDKRIIRNALAKGAADAAPKADAAQAAAPARARITPDAKRGALARVDTSRVKSQNGGMTQNDAAARTHAYTGTISSDRKERVGDTALTEHVRTLVLTADTPADAEALGFGESDTPLQVGDEVMVDTFGKLRRGIVTQTTRNGANGGNTRVMYSTPTGDHTVLETTNRTAGMLRLVDPSRRPAPNRAALLPKVKPEPVSRKRTPEQVAAAKAADKVRQAENDAATIARVIERMQEGRGVSGGLTERGYALLAKELGVPLPRLKKDRNAAFDEKLVAAARARSAEGKA